MQKILLSARGISKSFGSGDTERTVLQGVSLTVHSGEVLGIVGKSGSGKSTLLQILASLERPDSGKLEVQGCDILQCSEKEMADFRLRRIGIVFQFFNLLPTLTLLDNVLLSAALAGTPPREARKRAEQLLNDFEVIEPARRYPHEASGGEQQRAAVARALMNDPEIILADEPTGNLDSTSAEKVLETLQMLGSLGKGVVIVSHERDLTKWVTRLETLRDGKLC